MTTEDDHRSSEVTPPATSIRTEPEATAPEASEATEPPTTAAAPPATEATAPKAREATAPKATETVRPKKPPHKKSFMRELPGIVITALVISVLIKTFLVQAFYIPSGSMENTLLVNDRVLVNKLADKPDEIHRGDVVVFQDPGGWLAGPGEGDSGNTGVIGWLRDGLVFVGLAPATGEEDLIKRVIGVGGDKVKCCDENKRITVNGVPLVEPYLHPSDLKQPSQSTFSVTVPKGSLWVMGDHRTVSEDSRAHQDQTGDGFVPVSKVVGRAFTIVWPLDRAKLLHRPDTYLQPKLTGSSR